MAHEQLHWRAAQLATVAALLALPSLVQPYFDGAVAAFGGPRLAYAIGVLALHMVVLAVGNGFFYVLYRTTPAWAERFRIITNKPWPWASPKAEVRAQFATLVRMAVGLTLFNNLVIALPLAYFNYPTLVKLGFAHSAAEFPAWWTIAWQLGAFMVIEDTLFYWGHRTLHHPSIYAYVHKLHHRYNHSVSIAAEFAHPIEFLFSNVVPFAAGPTLLGAHLVTHYIWVIWRIGETIHNHSGYDFPWGPWKLVPFPGSATLHDDHHSKNTGNYASFFSLWDTWMGTEIPRKEEKEVEKKEKAKGGKGD